MPGVFRWVMLLVLACTVSAFGLENAAVRGQEFPNVVLLMGDDHGWEETGYNGHPHVKTPVLDEMAATALKFEHFYAAHPTCSPTRASFLTGRHPNRMGTFAPGWSMRPEEITLAHIMSRAGYYTAHLGKWHVGTVKSDSPLNPGAFGFDEWLSHDNFFEMNPPFSRNGAPPEVFPGESSEVLIDETIQFIERSREKGQPFFAVVWFGSPHEPYSGLDKDLALYDDLPQLYPDKLVRLTSNKTGQQVTRPQGEVLRERYAEITAMDRSIGTLRTYLAEQGLRDNTILFYCGDNGTSADGLLSSPHRGKKGDIYDGGTLVPGLVEWPTQILDPVSTTVRASTSDLLPTFANLVGQPLPDRPLDGIDLTPVLDNQNYERPEPLFFWKFHLSGYQRGREPTIDPALQVGTTPLVKLMGNKATRDFTNFQHPEVVEEDYRGERSIIDGRYKLIARERGGQVEFELYNLRSDPAEKRNLVEEEAETVERLKKKLRDWQTSVLNSLTGADY